MQFDKIRIQLLVLSFLLLISTTLYAQNVTVSGVVTNAQTGKVMPGVNITVQGTSQGTTTNAEGGYEITTSPDATLVFSFIGYKERQIPVNSRTTIDVALKPQAVSGEEMVVVGYGRQRSANISSAQSAISAEDFNKQPVTMVSGALDAKTAGVRVQRTSGKPGAGYKIRIRGSNSINGSNSPLYVVDGLQVNNISNINPGDIASIKILKDASATAIYGSRGANGVVLITTKSGTSRNMQIDFRSSIGFQTVQNRLDLLNGAQFARVVNAEREATGGNPPFSDQEIADLEANGGTDWQDLAFREGAPLQQYNLSFSKGGMDGLNYFISGGYLNQKGVVIKQNYQRYNIRSNIDYQYSDKLKFSLHVQGSREVRDGNIMDVGDAIQFDPTLPPLKDENGNYTLSSSYASIHPNPYIRVMKSRRNNINGKVNSRGTVQYNFTDALSLNILGGIEYFNVNNNNYSSKIIDDRGHARLRNYRRFRVQNTNRLTFNKDFNANNHLKADLIFEQQYIRNEGHNINASDFPTDATGYKKANLASTIKANSSFRTEKLLSYVGRINYVWREKYIVTASARYDGSSKFRKGNRYGFFPAFSIGWRVANEKFMQNLTFIDQFKLRASYGETGSQAIAPLATRANLVSGVNYPIDDSGSRTIGIAPSNKRANPNLTWETTKQANIGVDMAFFNSRLSFTADAYRKITTDLLLNTPLPDFTGVNNVTRNLGKIENRGLELSLGLTPIRNNELNLDLNFNVSINRNKVKSLGGKETLYKGPHNGPTGGLYPVIVKQGHPLGVFQGYTFQGVYQKDQAEEAAKYGHQPGDAIYKDLNNDGTINGQDVSIIGHAQPDFLYGFSGTLSYRNFDLNVVINGSYGGQIYNIIKGQRLGQAAVTLDPTSKAILNRWTPDNPSNTIPGFTETTQTYLAASNFIEDGTYLKIKNIALGYNLPNNMLNNISLTSVRLFASVQNLATFTKFSGFDPQLHKGGDLLRGLYYLFPTYPLSRTITFGVDIKF